MQNIVTFVQNHSHRKREDLAGELLCLLLREEPGQKVLHQLLGGHADESLPIELETRRSSLGCVPDIYLLQSQRSRKPIALMELKFWATLTPHQLSGRYFEVAPHLLFVIPEERLEALRLELADQATKHSLELRSWTEILGRLADAADADGPRDQRLFAGAVDHLKEFCKVIDHQVFFPFSKEQLSSPVEDSTTRHLLWLVQGVLSWGKKEELIQEGGRLMAGFDESFFYGQNVILKGYRLWLGYWPKAWKRSPRSGPLWLEFFPKEAKALMQTGQFQDGIRVDDDLAFPLLRPDHGAVADQEEELSAVFGALEAFALRLPLEPALLPENRV